MDYAAEEARIAVLQDLFREELGRWPVDRRKELLGELVLWGSVVPIGRSLWHGVLSQIEYIARESRVSTEDAIRALCRAETVDSFMLAFQGGLALLPSS
jgi:hypothetical protein